MGQTRAATAPVERAGPRPAGGAAARAGAAPATAVTTAVVLATARAEGGTAAAAQPWEDTTVLRRMLEQLASLGVSEVLVLTRPELERQLRPFVAGLDGLVRLEASPGLSADLEAVAALARSGTGGLVVLQGEVVTQREALAGLLADPRIATGALATTGVTGRPFAFRLRSRRGRVISASSPFHSVTRPTAGFLGVLKVAASDRERLAAVAAHLSGLTHPEPPPEWQDELRRKAGMWKVLVAGAAARRDALERGEEPPAPEPGAPPPDPADVVLAPRDDEELARRVAAAPGDVASLLLVGLVRAGVHVGVSHLRKLFWARPLSREALESAGERILDHDEDRVLLESAVKANDGFFTTYFVSPYSKYIARWAARRGLTPNQVTTLSVLIGVGAAAAFATGERWGYLVGAVALQVAFTTDCVDGQLARYTRTFSKLGAWLDSVFDRTKEYVVFAGLALGAAQAGEPAWLLACAALTLQTVRHTFDFSYGAAQHQVIGATVQPPLEQPSDSLNPRRAAPVDAERDESELEAEVPDAVQPAVPLHRRLPRQGLRLWHAFDRLPPVFWLKKMIAFPIGERFAVISITTALFDPRTTFIVLLAWGGLAAAYTIAGRLLRSVAA